MNAKKYFVTLIALSTVLLAFAASFRQAKRDDKPPGSTALTGPGGKFGPLIEAVLPAKARGAIDIFDLETGGTLLHPPLDFNARADKIMAWVRSNGLDISGFTWSGGGACITYDMAIVAVEGKRWDEITEQELFRNPVLAPGRHSPRKLLLQGDNRPDIHLFRTGEGTLGRLQIVGPSKDGRGVNIRYQLINPANSANFVAAATESRANQDP